MISSDLWEDVWTVLEFNFRTFAERIRPSVPNMKTATGHNSNEAFAFSAYFTFRSHTDYAIDLSIDCKLEPDHLVVSADIARETGFVLADVRETRISLLESREKIETEIRDAINAIIEFFGGHIPLICNELTSSFEDPASEMSG